MVECIRRLGIIPEVEIIATSHRAQNEPAARLYAALGFVPWERAWVRDSSPEEVYLKLE